MLIYKKSYDKRKTNSYLRQNRTYDNLKTANEVGLSYDNNFDMKT